MLLLISMVAFELCAASWLHNVIALGAVPEASLPCLSGKDKLTVAGKAAGLGDKKPAPLATLRPGGWFPQCVQQPARAQLHCLVSEPCAEKFPWCDSVKTSRFAASDLLVAGRVLSCCGKFKSFVMKLFNYTLVFLVGKSTFTQLCKSDLQILVSVHVQ